MSNYDDIPFDIPGDNYDYTAGDQPTPEIDALNLTIGEAATIDHDADAVEAAAKAREWVNMKPGQYRLMVEGFGKVTKDMKVLFTAIPKSPDGQPVRQAFEATTVIVRFVNTANPQEKITDAFILPPSNPADLKVYNHGSTKPDGSTAGFHAEKFGHFLNRLIGGFSKGQALPPAARNLKEWIGRMVDAEVVLSKARDSGKKDPTTGAPIIYQARPQIKLYSYKSCGNAPVHAAQQGQRTLPRGAANI